MTSTAASESYVSTAFYSQYNLILLGGSALFSLAAASAWPLALGVGAELLWLGLGSRLPVFRRSVDAQADAEQRARLDDEVVAGMRGLSAEHTARLQGVTQAISAVSLQASAASAVDPDLRGALLELERLRPAFLRLCQLHERLAQRLQELALQPPEHEVARLSQAYAAEKDLGLRLTLHQAIKQAQKKIEQQARMVDTRRTIDLKLSMIEQALGHLVSQQQLGAPAQDLARDIHGLVVQADATASLEAELTELGATSIPPHSAPVSR